MRSMRAAPADGIAASSVAPGFDPALRRADRVALAERVCVARARRVLRVRVVVGRRTHCLKQPRRIDEPRARRANLVEPRVAVLLSYNFV